MPSIPTSRAALAVIYPSSFPLSAWSTELAPCSWSLLPQRCGHSWSVHLDMQAYEFQEACSSLSGPSAGRAPQSSQAADQEKVGVKAWKLLSTKIRCMFLPDCCHGSWNDTSAALSLKRIGMFTRDSVRLSSCFPAILTVAGSLFSKQFHSGNALSRAGQAVTTLKATILSACAHGPSLGCIITKMLTCLGFANLRFQGGATWLSKQDMAERFVQKYQYDEEKLTEMAELMRSDLGCEVPAEAVPGSIQEWATMDAVQKRGMYVTRRHNVIVVVLSRSRLVCLVAVQPTNRGPRERLVWAHGAVPQPSS